MHKPHPQAAYRNYAVLIGTILKKHNKKRAVQDSSLRFRFYELYAVSP